MHPPAACLVSTVTSAQTVKSTHHQATVCLSEHSTLSVSLQVRETIECWVYPVPRTYSSHTDLQCASDYMWVHFVAELAKMAAVVSLKLSQLISQARDCILHLLSVTALGPDSHSLLSVGFISSTRRTMNENYGPSCTKMKTMGCENKDC